MINRVYFLITSLLFITSFWLGLHCYLNQDVAIILHTAANMQQGASYATGILEPNPPLIFFLNYPALWLAKILHIPILNAFIGYVLSLCGMSLWISRLVLAPLFKYEMALLNQFMLAMVIILLFLHIDSFGQREHLLIILCLPYLFLAARRLEKINTHPMLALMIGMMAASGFAIKPYFLAAWILVELLLVINQRSIMAWIRVESMLVLSLGVAYGVLIIMVYPAYWQHVLPLWLPYYAAIAQPWLLVLSNPAFWIAVIAFILLQFNPFKQKHDSLKRVFAQANLGFIIAYLIPQVAWYYHSYPALALACLSCSLCFFEGIQTKHVDLVKLSQTTLCGFLATYVLLSYSIPYYSAARKKTVPIAQLIEFLDENPAGTSYGYLSINHRLQSLEFHSKAVCLENFPLFWEFNHRNPTYYSSTVLQARSRYLIDQLSQEMEKNKPQYMIIDTKAAHIYLHQDIDYPKEYSQNERFQQVWKHYLWIKKIGPFDIYQRQMRY